MDLTHQLRVWLYGIIGAFIGGLANGITLTILDPLQFNLFQGGAAKLGTACIVSGLVSFALYVKAHPLPNIADADVQQVTAAKIVQLQAIQKAAS